MSKLQRTIDRTQEKISQGQYYEAHQAVRTIAARYIRQKAYDEAIEVLYNASIQLLDASQAGSASDLVLYVVSTFQVAETKVDASSRAKLAQLLSKFPLTEPTLKKIGHEITVWASQYGQYKYGDPELNHILGSIFARADEAYEAEKYLLLGTRESPRVLAKLLYEWSQEDSNSQTLPLYASRGVLGYLCIGNIRDSKALLDEFISQCPQDWYTAVEQQGEKATLFKDYPLMTFLQLLVLSCQYKNADMFNRLKNRYSDKLRDVQAFNVPLARIGRDYFGIEPPRQHNMLQDLMGSLFM